MLIFTILFGLAGWPVGVAINHAADILPTRQTIRQRPHCPACSERRPSLAWSALLAYLSRQTVCPNCGQQRDRLARSLIVELVTPFLFGFLGWHYGPSVSLGLVSIYTAILVLVTVTDLEHRLILNVVIVPAIILATIAAFFTPDLSWRAAVVGGAVGFILSYLAALLARGGLGGGDVTLSTFLGLILGFPNILLSLLFGVFLGGFVAFLLLLSRRVGMKTFIPYGPFLTTTGWIMLIWGNEIWAYYFW